MKPITITKPIEFNAGPHRMRVKSRDTKQPDRWAWDVEALDGAVWQEWICVMWFPKAGGQYDFGVQTTGLRFRHFVSLGTLETIWSVVLEDDAVNQR